MARRKRLSYKLVVFAPWRKLVDMHPAMLFVALVMISPVMMWLNDILLVHGRFIPPNQQWLSAQFDIALALAAAVAVANLRNIDVTEIPVGLRARKVHWVCLLLGVAFSAVHMWQERASIPTVERRMGPNSLYHNLVLYPLLGYLLLILVIAVVAMLAHGYWRMPLYVAGVCLMATLIGGWLWAGNYDRTHQYAPGGVHKSVIANPPDPWCGGLLTKPICGPPQR